MIQVRWYLHFALWRLKFAKLYLVVHAASCWLSAHLIDLREDLERWHLEALTDLRAAVDRAERERRR